MVGYHQICMDKVRHITSTIAIILWSVNSIKPSKHSCQAILAIVPRISGGPLVTKCIMNLTSGEQHVPTKSFHVTYCPIKILGFTSRSFSHVKISFNDPLAILREVIGHLVS